MLRLDLNESDALLLTDALAELRKAKAAAFVSIKSGGARPFTERDFGIPQIDALVTRIDALEDSDD